MTDLKVAVIVDLSYVPAPAENGVYLFSDEYAAMAWMAERLVAADEIVEADGQWWLSHYFEEKYDMPDHVIDAWQEGLESHDYFHIRYVRQAEGGGE